MIRMRAPRPEEFARFTSFETHPDANRFVNTYKPDEHARMAARDDVTYFAIEYDGELDGFVLLVLDPDGVSVELRRIVVATPDRGTGQFALAEAERYCRDELGRTRLWLDVWPPNVRAVHVYRKFGFEPWDRPPTPGGAVFLHKRITDT